MTGTPGGSLLSIRELSKSYQHNLVLQGINVELRDGEIHALLGENGAGKSTLIKILAGVTGRDSGTITVLGRTLGATFTARDATAAGLAFVHQDLGLIEQLSVAENIALVTGYAGRSGLVSITRTEAAAEALLQQLGVTIDPRAAVSSLSHDRRVLVAVARAFAQHARIFVLDELTSSLSAPDATRLTTTIRAMARPGFGFIYVTHRLDELDGFADHVTVLRDGRLACSMPYRRQHRETIVDAIVGDRSARSHMAHPARARPRSFSRNAQDARRKTPLLTVTQLGDGKQLAPISFELSHGEVLGVCGIVGSGIRALAALLSGASQPACGSVHLERTRLRLGNARIARKAGVAVVPGNRVTSGTIADLSVQENLFLCCLRHTPKRVNSRRELESARTVCAHYSVRPQGCAQQTMRQLSGGNQQKVIVARALRMRPRVLVCEDLTAGVDIGSRSELHEMVRSHAEQGCAVVLLSSDYDEVAQLSDRALVMVRGKVNAELAGAQLTARKLSQASFSSADVASNTP